MKSFFFNLSSRFPFFANRPSALERAVRQSPKSRRLRMEPLENRVLLAVDAFGASAFLASDVGESWGPDPAPAAFSASVLATDAAIVDVSGIDATSAAASFSVQAATPTPVAPPSFDQLMESLGMIEIESLDDETDVASASYLDNVTKEIAATSDATVRRVVFEGSDVDAESLDEPTVVVPLATVDVNGGAGTYSTTSGNESASLPVKIEIFESTSGASGGVPGVIIPLPTPQLESNSNDYDVFMRCILLPDDVRNDFQIVSVGAGSGGGSSLNLIFSDGVSQYIPISGGTSYAIRAQNDCEFENDEIFQILYYTKPAGSGGNSASYTRLPNTGCEITIVDDDQWKAQITPPQTLDVYEPRLGSTAPPTVFTLKRVANETAIELQNSPLVNYTLDSGYAMNVKLKFAFNNGAAPSDFRLEKYSLSQGGWTTVDLTQANNNAYAYIDIGVNQTQTQFRISGIADDRVEGREAVIISIDSVYAGTTDNLFEADSTVVYSWIYESPEFRNNMIELVVDDDTVDYNTLSLFPSVGAKIPELDSWFQRIAYSAGQTLGYELSGADAQYFEINQENQCVRWKKLPTDNHKTFNFVLKAFDVDRKELLYDEVTIKFKTP